MFLLIYLSFNGYIAHESSEIIENNKFYLRISGRAGLLLLFITFCSAPIHRHFKSAWSSYLIKNRRYYGISTGIVMWFHLLVMLSLYYTAPGWLASNVPWLIFLLGCITTMFLGVLALSSNKYSQKKLGIKKWKKTHLIGSYIATLSFIVGYILVLYVMPILLPNNELLSPDGKLLKHLLFFVSLLILYIRLFFYGKPNAK